MKSFAEEGLHQTSLKTDYQNVHMMCPGSSLAVALVLLPVLMCVADDCRNVNHQTEVNIHAFIGTWFVVETVDHNRSLEHPTTVDVDSCPRLAVVSYNDSTRYLIMNWMEDSKDLKYYFKVDYTPGLWTTIGRQEGSMAELPHYDQFHGQVKVLKAVGDHFVITFCPLDYSGNRRPKSPYSMVLWNDRGMSPSEIEDVNRMLKNRGLHMGLVKKLCPSGGATSALVSLTLLVVTVVVSVAQYSGL